MEGSHFLTQQGTCPKIRVQFCGKVVPAACTQHIFRLGRMTTCVDQSAQLILCWMKMSTLLCRQMTRVHPVVSSTLNLTPYIYKKTAPKLSGTRLLFSNCTNKSFHPNLCFTTSRQLSPIHVFDVGR